MLFPVFEQDVIDFKIVHVKSFLLLYEAAKDQPKL